MCGHEDWHEWSQQKGRRSKRTIVDSGSLAQGVASTRAVRPLADIGFVVSLALALGHAGLLRGQEGRT